MVQWPIPMAQERLTRRQQLQQAKEALIRNQDRGQHERFFERRLEELQEINLIFGWSPETDEEALQLGIHYRVDTAKGTVPFGLSSTHRKAQLKRRQNPQLRHTSMHIIGQHHRGYKPAEILRQQIVGSIYAYWKANDG